MKKEQLIVGKKYWIKYKNSDPEKSYVGPAKLLSIEEMGELLHVFLIEEDNEECLFMDEDIVKQID